MVSFAPETTWMRLVIPGNPFICLLAEIDANSSDSFER